MLKIMLYTYKKCQEVLSESKPMSSILNTRIFDDLIKIKYEVDEDLTKFDAYYKKVDSVLASIE